MNSKKISLYVGCSLTQAPEDFKEEIAALKEKLKEKYEVMEFLGLVDGTEQDVYRWDIHECVGKCDIFIAFCDLPSIGLGYELGTAIEKLETPTLMLAQTDAKVTRLVIGVDQPHATFSRYESLADAHKQIDDFIELHAK